MDGYKYFKIKAVRETDKLVLGKEKSRKDLIYNNIASQDYSCYLKFSFNIFGIIDEITYFGKVPVEYSSLIALVGLHETYLNDLFSRTEVGLVEDIPQFLSENWAMALFHDNFSNLIMKLKNIIITDPDYTKDIKAFVNAIIQSDSMLDRNYLPTVLSNVRDELKKKLEYEILLFLEENKNHLPFYYTGDIKHI